MLGEMMENNSVIMKGWVESQPTFSHEIYGEGFYLFKIKVPRLSDSFDYLPVIFSERLVEPEKIVNGKMIAITGQYRSYNNVSSEKHKLVLSVFARELEFIDSIDDITEANSITLNGFICKKPIFRKTPSGREIADVLLAVNRSYNKSDYIPCISWGRNARFCEKISVGENITVIGRVQSRQFNKKLADDTYETRVAYEVSVSKIFTGGARQKSGMVDSLV